MRKGDAILSLASKLSGITIVYFGFIFLILVAFFKLGTSYGFLFMLLITLLVPYFFICLHFGKISAPYIEKNFTSFLLFSIVGTTPLIINLLIALYYYYLFPVEAMDIVDLAGLPYKIVLNCFKSSGHQNLLYILFYVLIILSPYAAFYVGCKLTNKK